MGFKRITGLVVFAVSVAFTVNSSHGLLKSNLYKSGKFYANNKVLYMHTLVKGVSSKNGSLQKIGEAELFRDDEKFYSNGFGIEMYCDGKKVIVFNHLQKKATLFLSFDAKRLMKEQAVPVDSLAGSIQPTDSVVYTKNDNMFRIYENKNKLKYTDVGFDQKDGYIKNYNYSVAIFGDDLHSDYKEIKVNYDKVLTKLPRNINFKVDQFVSKSGSGYSLSSKKYSHYQLKVKKYYYESIAQ